MPILGVDTTTARLHRAASPGAWASKLSVASSPHWRPTSRLQVLRGSAERGWARGGLSTSKASEPAFERLGRWVGKGEYDAAGLRRGKLFSPRVSAGVSLLARSPGAAAGAAIGAVMACCTWRWRGPAPAGTFAAHLYVCVLFSVDLFSLTYLAAVLVLGPGEVGRLFAWLGGRLSGPQVREDDAGLPCFPLAASALVFGAYHLARYLVPPFVGACRVVACTLGAAAGAVLGILQGLRSASRPFLAAPAPPTARAAQGMGGLPPELVVHIARFLSLGDASALARTSRAAHALHLTRPAVARALAGAHQTFPAAHDAAEAADEDATPLQRQRDQLRCSVELPQLLRAGQRFFSFRRAYDRQLERRCRSTFFEALPTSAVAQGKLFFRIGSADMPTPLNWLGLQGPVPDPSQPPTRLTKLLPFQGGLLGYRPRDRQILHWTVGPQGNLSDGVTLDVDYPLAEVVVGERTVFALGEGHAGVLTAFGLHDKDWQRHWRPRWHKKMPAITALTAHGDALFYQRDGRIEEIDGLSGELRFTYAHVASPWGHAGRPLEADSKIAATNQFVLSYTPFSRDFVSWCRGVKEDYGRGYVPLREAPQPNVANREDMRIRSVGEHFFCFSRAGSYMLAGTYVSRRFPPFFWHALPSLFDAADTVALVGTDLVVSCPGDGRIIQLPLMAAAA